MEQIELFGMDYNHFTIKCMCMWTVEIVAEKKSQHSIEQIVLSCISIIQASNKFSLCMDEAKLFIWRKKNNCIVWHWSIRRIAATFYRKHDDVERTFLCTLLSIRRRMIWLAHSKAYISNSSMPTHSYTFVCVDLYVDTRGRSRMALWHAWQPRT